MILKTFTAAAALLLLAGAAQAQTPLWAKDTPIAPIVAPNSVTLDNMLMMVGKTAAFACNAGRFSSCEAAQMFREINADALVQAEAGALDQQTKDCLYNATVTGSRAILPDCAAAMQRPELVTDAHALAFTQALLVVLG